MLGLRSIPFSRARRLLMLPHCQGEAADIAGALRECRQGLLGFPDDDLDIRMRELVKELEALMRTGVQDPSNRDSFDVVARRLSAEQMERLSDILDELADWFEDSRNQGGH